MSALSTQDGGLFYRCGVPHTFEEAALFYDSASYVNQPGNELGLNIANHTVDLERYEKFKHDFELRGLLET